MNSKLLYWVWSALFALVLGCVYWPGSATKSAVADITATLNRPAAAAAAGTVYRGVAIQIHRVDQIELYKRSIDDAADVGADTVSLVILTRMENGTSNRIWLDMRLTPTPQQLGELIDYAKRRNLRVLIMPIVLLENPRHNEWRGTIKPEDWNEWFDSYRAMILHFAWIAEQHKADILSVGSELVTTEDKVEQWRRTIHQVRQAFSGKLTYSANWDHYVSIPFWSMLDLVGMNSYWKLGNNNKVAVEQIKAEWRDIQEDLLDFIDRVQRPLLFMEVGWCSLANAAHEPWDYTRISEPLDLDLQKRLYQGFFEAWHGNPRLGGFMIWEWPPESGGSSDKGYIPKGKPAEAVLREWLAKEPWMVR